MTLALAVPGEHNRHNAAAALAALELAGVPRADAEAAMAEFRGAGRRLEPKGRPAASPFWTATRIIRPSSPPISQRFATADGLLALFQPHLYSRTLHLAHGFARALAGADAACVTEIYPAREEPCRA